MPELVLKLGDNVLQTYVFDKDVMSIGRSRDNDVVVENLSVSRNHARVRRQNGKYILTDLNSANGTYVNGVRVSKTEIVNEDVISIGKHKLFFNDQPVNEEKMIADAFGADRTVVVDRAPAPVLCISDGKLKGQEFNITKFETSVGKAPSNDIVLSDDWFLAKKQAVIIRRGNHDYEIHDMGGFKRTKVNGVQINEPRALQPGDVLEFGNTRCVFQMAGDVPAPTGRVPQEMALDDSIFSSGVSYSEPEAPSEAPEIETPFVAASEAPPVEEVFEEAEAVIDTNEMARAAIAADERVRAEVRSAAQQAPADELPVYGVAPDADMDSARDNAPLVASAQEEVLSLDDDYSAAPSTFVESQAEDAPSEAPPEEAQEEPAAVYAGISEELRTQNGEHAAPAEAPFAPAIPITPAMPPSGIGAPPMVSASGGRANRKKKRDRGSDAPNYQQVPPPAFDESMAPVEEAAAPPPTEHFADSSDQIPAAPEPEVSSSTAVDELVASASTDGPSHSDQAAEKAELQPASDAEIALWEAALQNRSAVIRRQAAKMLKKLTGKDYEV